MATKFALSLTLTKWLLLLSLAAGLMLSTINNIAQSFFGLPSAAVLCLTALTILALLHFKVGHQLDEWILRFYIWFFCMGYAVSFACTSIPVEVGPLAWITAKGNHVSWLQVAFVVLQQVFHLGLSMAACWANRQELERLAAPWPVAITRGSAIDLDVLC